MCIDGGLKIDVEKTLPIDKIDIHLGWFDAYGNLHPLRLTYGACCNVRLCFTRKTVHENYDYVKHDGVARTMFYIPNEGMADQGAATTAIPGKTLNMKHNHLKCK